ncbi:MAG: AsnC family transcriptional regulator [Gammaproteobacteria bacterium]|nr:AsnC family transcriptional regulator [Gammaproteobacteria bacterium]MCW9059327.1 AsnC family transcriptional regulator [Gammaproteobacteria bacterium]
MELNVRQRRVDTTGIDADDRRLLEQIQEGLPLVSRPFAEIAARLGMAEAEVIARIERLRGEGVIKRMGVVVRHRPLGYDANAMVVWDVPDARVDALGQCFARFPFVTLCYQRPRRGAPWPYNLFCMIHGKDRDAVLDKIAELREACGVGEVRHQILFSRRCFKQRGANYRRGSP